MGYLQALKGLVFGTPEIFQLTSDHKNKAGITIPFINLILCGTFFGYANYLVTAPNLGEFIYQGLYRYGTPFLFIVSGIILVFLTASGFSLIYWAMGKGFGGYNTYIACFKQVGLISPGMWIIAPLGLILKTGALNGIYSSLLVLLISAAAGWTLINLVRSFQFNHGLSKQRAWIAAITTIIFCISSVYLFNQ